jgi:hypothetical protein
LRQAPESPGKTGTRKKNAKKVAMHEIATRTVLLMIGILHLAYLRPQQVINEERLQGLLRRVQSLMTDPSPNVGRRFKSPVAQRTFKSPDDATAPQLQTSHARPFKGRKRAPPCFLSLSVHRPCVYSPIHHCLPFLLFRLSRLLPPPLSAYGFPLMLRALLSGYPLRWTKIIHP